VCWRAATLVLIALVIDISPAAVAWQTPSVTHCLSGSEPWPRKVVIPGATIEVYQPQLNRWSGNKLEAHAAVAIKSRGSNSRANGVVWFTARTEVDKENHLVTLQDFRVAKQQFPSLVDNGSRYTAAVRATASMQIIPLDVLETSSIAANEANDQRTYQLENEEPRIIFSTRPAVLVSIDGDPALRPAGENLQIVVNTRAPIMFDSDRRIYYLAMMDGWLRAPLETGKWSLVEDGTARSLYRLRRAAGLATPNQALGNPERSLKRAFQKKQVPAIYLATVPTELLVTQGSPKFTPILGTNLFYVLNSENDIFLDTSNQRFYILVSGRWFASNSLQNGPWSYVTSTDLPSDFTEIPPSSRKASVLASVPGTPQAKKAWIENQIPQTATISRRAATLDVKYFGAPDFRLIEGTQLLYAVNTTTPVVYIPANKMYYAVRNAVWFGSHSATGPWAVAISVPRVIYTIPPSCPIHYVTYVEVYGYTSVAVYVGYTPGYFGAMASGDNVVVYGTGWSYPPYISAADWAPQPYTYGAGTGFSCNAGDWGFVRPALHKAGIEGTSTANVYRRWHHRVYAGTRAAWAKTHPEPSHFCDVS
jgi:hypothetical protein